MLDFRNSAEMAECKVNEHSYITRVYSWMCFALVITGLVAFYIASNPPLIRAIFKNQAIYWGLIILEFVLVIALVKLINKISAFNAAMIFIGFSALNGVVLSLLLLVYTSTSVASTFFITAGTFAVMSCFGWYTKKDLTSLGNLLFMALIGFIIATVVNIFLQNTIMYWIITYIGIIIFVGLIAYDTQKIKKMSGVYAANSEASKKSAIMGALALYLDFINLFILLLRIFGDRR